MKQGVCGGRRPGDHHPWRPARLSHPDIIYLVCPGCGQPQPDAELPQGVSWLKVHSKPLWQRPHSLCNTLFKTGPRRFSRAGCVSRGVVVFLCVPRVVYIVVVSAYVWACACGRAGAWACACGRARACAPVCFARAATVSASVVVLRMGGVAVCGSAV